MHLHHTDRSLALSNGIINDAEPQSRGHVVFFPKWHSPDLIDMSDEELAEMLLVIKRVATRSKESL